MNIRFDSTLNKKFFGLIVKSFMEDVKVSIDEKEYDNFIHFLNETIDEQPVFLNWKLFEGLGLLFHLHGFVQMLNDYFSEKKINIKATYSKPKGRYVESLEIEFKEFIRLDYVSSVERDINKDSDKFISSENPMEYLFGKKNK